MTYHLQRLGPKAKAKRRPPRPRGPFGVRRRMHPRAYFLDTDPPGSGGAFDRRAARQRLHEDGFRAFAVAPCVIVYWPRNPGRPAWLARAKRPCIVLPTDPLHGYCGGSFAWGGPTVDVPRHPRACCPECVALWREATKEGK